MLAFDSVAVLQSFCLGTLVLIMFDVDEENIFQNDSLCCFISLPRTPPLVLLARTRNCSPLIIFREKRLLCGKKNKKLSFSLWSSAQLCYISFPLNSERGTK